MLERVAFKYPPVRKDAVLNISFAVESRMRLNCMALGGQPLTIKEGRKLLVTAKTHSAQGKHLTCSDNLADYSNPNRVLQTHQLSTPTRHIVVRQPCP